MNNSLEILSPNLKWFRKLLNINQQEFADGIGIARSNLSNYELSKNEIMLTTLIKISNYCNISIDDLVNCRLDRKIYNEKKKDFKSENRTFMNFSKNLKSLRIRNKLSQLELANAVGISNSKISIYEAGKSDVALSPLLQITSYFNISIEKIISFEIDYIQFSKEEITFLKNIDIDFQEMNSDKEFLKFLYNLKETYIKKSISLNKILNVKIPQKLKEINELIFLIEQNNNDDDRKEL